MTIINKVIQTAIILILLAGTHQVAMAAEAMSPPPPPTKKDKCPVCGMFVYKYPDWTTSVVLEDGQVLYFDGAKDMFRYLKTADMDKVASIWVKEYYGLTSIDARKAFYVIGSNVYGPMGHELIPFASKDDAEEFAHDHGGKHVLSFEEVDADILKELK